MIGIVVLYGLNFHAAFVLFLMKDNKQAHEVIGYDTISQLDAVFLKYAIIAIITRSHFRKVAHTWKDRIKHFGLHGLYVF